MKVKIEQAISMARNNESLKGLVIEDLNDIQVSAKDALLLAEYGILIPEQNIYYNDEDIAYDPDIDDVAWSKAPIKLTWEEKIQLAEKMAKNKNNEEEVSVKIRIEDREIRQWVNRNQERMGEILSKFIEQLYQAKQITKG